jgi:hypothetical protein
MRISIYNSLTGSSKFNNIIYSNYIIYSNNIILYINKTISKTAHLALLRNKEEIMKCNSSQKRISRRGRKPLLGDIEIS